MADTVASSSSSLANKSDPTTEKKNLCDVEEETVALDLNSLSINEEEKHGLDEPEEFDITTVCEFVFVFVLFFVWITSNTV